MPKRKVLTVVGGGASGTILTAYAVRHLKAPTDIYVIERSGSFGPGLAYGLDEPCFLLNVRAGRMGGFENDPNHFFEWVTNYETIWRTLHPSFANIKYTADDFVPRMIYGAYLQWIFQDAKKQAQRFDHKIISINGSVGNIKPEGEALLITCTGADSFSSDAVVFATGNSQSRQMTSESEKIFSAPYDSRFMNQDWKNKNHVVIFGTGLSMIDALQILKEKNFKGKITAISRRGLLPLPHQSIAKPMDSILNVETFHTRVSEIVRQIRTSMKERDWQDKIDSLRGVSNVIWHRLNTAQQKKLARIFPWWSIARHRIPDFVFEEIQKLKADQKLRVCTGNIENVHETGVGVEVKIKGGEIIIGDSLVHCTGFSYDAKSLQDICPEILLARHWSGSVAPIKGKCFRISEKYPVFAMGPLLSGWNFESTAVHEIRKQAADIIEEIGA